MTSTPHFALAQHPETGEWAVLEMSTGATRTWCHARVTYAHMWHRTRIDALADTRQWRYIFGRDVEVSELDRLIAIERDHAAGDEAQVQTITKMGGAE